MKQLRNLRALVAAIAEQDPSGQPLLTADEILAAEAPKDQPKRRLEQLRATLRSLGERFGAIEQTDSSVAILQDIAEAATAIDAELAGRPDPEAVAASLLASMRGGDAAADAGSPRPALGGVRAPNRPGRRSAVSDERAVATLTAGGRELSTDDELVQAFRAAVDQVDAQVTGRRGERGHALIASLRTEFPESRMLRQNAAADNAAKVDAAAGQALTASGGICGPLAVDYNVPTFASAERPIRDGLLRFGADRGGITFVPAPHLTDFSAAVSLWPEATDASPGESTKPVASIDCGSPTTVTVDALPMRLQAGNMLGRYSPEQVAAIVATTMAYGARFADLNLWTKINALGTEVTSTQYLGAARDLLATIDRSTAAMRYRQRVPRSKSIRCILPEFARDMIRADMARELATDSDGRDALAITDAQIDAWFSVRGIAPIWSLDGLPAQGSGNTYPLQGFAAQTSGALATWPTKIVFTLFVEGSVQFLDGGELNLGVVRDSSLNSTNDYELFSETFENVANRGIEILKVIAPVLASGASAGTATPTTSSI